jgi:glycosyltransferase involved in cell wall biosynthesis
MKILFVLANYYPYIGGAETASKSLAEGLVRRGHFVKVVTTHIAGTPLVEVVNGVEIERVRVPNLAKQYLFSFFSLPALVRQAHFFDLIQTSSNYSGLAGFLAARISRRPVVITCHEVVGDRWLSLVPNPLRARVLRFIEKTMLLLPYDRYEAVSQATLHDLIKLGVPQEKAAYIYHGINASFYSHAFHKESGCLRKKRGIPANEFLYVYFGRPGVTKGLDYLIHAVPDIHERLPNSHLVLILSHEPNDYYQHINKMITDLHLGDNIHLIDPLKDIPSLIQHLLDVNCIVVPSITEGFGLTTAEACALGIPIVATNAGSIPEVISGKFTLVEPGSADAIARAVVRAEQDDFDQMIPVKKFTWEENVSKYEKTYQAVLSTSPGFSQEISTQ